MYYEIENTTIRILGSVHLFPKGSMGMPARVDAAYHWAESICFEHRIADVMARMTLPDGTRLPDLLAPELWTQLDAQWRQPPGIPSLSSLKPWAAMVLFMGGMLDGEPGVEPWMFQRLAADGRDSQIIETAAEVAASFDSVPLAAYQAALAHAMAHAGEAHATFRATYDSWVRGAADALWTIVQRGPMAQDPALWRGMITDRNRRWAARIADQVGKAERRTLLVLGAVHLVGPDNLVELLGGYGHAVREVGG